MKTYKNIFIIAAALVVSIVGCQCLEVPEMIPASQEEADDDDSATPYLMEGC